jgi:HKD family nuclease
MSEFLSNDDESLAASMECWLQLASDASWAVAYVRKTFIDRLSRALDEFERRGGKLRLLTGSGQGFTEAEALGLLRLVEGVEIRVYDAPGVTFHPKLYVFRDGVQAAIVGSANLSGGAFSGNIEVAAEITSETDSEFIRRSLEWFDQVWQQSTPLNDALLAAFRANERRPSEDEFHRVFKDERERYEAARSIASGERFEQEEIFEPGRQYTNEELSRIAMVSTQGGIRFRGSTAGIIERCVIITGSDRGAFYRDRPGETTGRIIYTGEGRTGAQSLTRGNLALKQQKEARFPLHLFQRRGKNNYQYLGQYRVVDYGMEPQTGEDGVLRQAYVFELMWLGLT